MSQAQARHARGVAVRPCSIDRLFFRVLNSSTPSRPHLLTGRAVFHACPKACWSPGSPFSMTPTQTQNSKESSQNIQSQINRRNSHHIPRRPGPVSSKNPVFCLHLGARSLHTFEALHDDRSSTALMRTKASMVSTERQNISSISFPEYAGLLQLCYHREVHCATNHFRQITREACMWPWHQADSQLSVPFRQARRHGSW